MHRQGFCPELPSPVEEAVRRPLQRRTTDQEFHTSAKCPAQSERERDRACACAAARCRGRERVREQDGYKDGYKEREQQHKSEVKTPTISFVALIAEISVIRGVPNPAARQPALARPLHSARTPPNGAEDDVPTPIAASGAASPQSNDVHASQWACSRQLGASASPQQAGPGWTPMTS